MLVGKVLLFAVKALLPISWPQWRHGDSPIMKQMLEHVPDAGSYAPVTILIDERPDGVHLSYDRIASFLSTSQNKDALKVARDLDSKVETLLTTAAADR